MLISLISVNAALAAAFVFTALAGEYSVIGRIA